MLRRTERARRRRSLQQTKNTAGRSTHLVAHKMQEQQIRVLGMYFGTGNANLSGHLISIFQFIPVYRGLGISYSI